MVVPYLSTSIIKGILSHQVGTRLQELRAGSPDFCQVPKWTSWRLTFDPSQLSPQHSSLFPPFFPSSIVLTYFEVGLVHLHNLPFTSQLTLFFVQLQITHLSAKAIDIEYWLITHTTKFPINIKIDSLSVTYFRNQIEHTSECGTYSQFLILRRKILRKWNSFWQTPFFCFEHLQISSHPSS